MSDMRLSSLTWHVLERPWLSAHSQGRDGKKDSKDGVWKKPGSVTLLSFNHAGQLSTFWVKEILRAVSAFGKRRTMNGLEGWGGVEEWRNGRIVDVYASVGWKTEQNIKQLQPMIKP